MTKYSGAMIATPRRRLTRLVGSAPRAQSSGSAASHTVTVRLAILNSTRCSGFAESVRSVHCAVALTAAMHTVGAGPSASRAQKFTA